MKTPFVKKAWHYYAATFVIIAVFFLLRNTDDLVVGAAGIHGLNQVPFIIVAVITFSLALDMGFENIRLKWLYPFFVAIYAHVVLPLATFMARYPRNPFDEHFFMFYLVIGFFFVFLGYLTVTFLGVGIGVLIRRFYAKNNHKEC